MSGSSQTPCGFTGEWADTNGLIYLRNRYYNPVLGVFPNLDPVEGVPEQPMSLNRYSYVRNNPVNFADPSGLAPQPPSSYALPSVSQVLQSLAQLPNLMTAFNMAKQVTEGCADQPVSDNSADQTMSCEATCTSLRGSLGPLGFVPYLGCLATCYALKALRGSPATPPGPAHYEPQKWNTDPIVEAHNNCYNYVANQMTCNVAQPGFASGITLTPNDYNSCETVGAAAMADGFLPATGKTCPPGCYEAALALYPGQDYHWYRQDDNGTWSSKQGANPATNLDFAGNIVTDPATAGRGAYTQFCGYYCVCSDKVKHLQGQLSGPCP